MDPSGGQYALVKKRSWRVLVVEDEPLVRSALEKALGDDGWSVWALADGRDIEHAVRQFQPDVALIDVHLPVGPDGYQLALGLRANSDIPVLFLSAADGEKDRLAGFAAGGDDYVTKPFSIIELLARLRALRRRPAIAPAGGRQIGDMRLHEGTRTVSRGEAEIELRETEYALLSAMAQRPGHVFTKTELLTLVWRYPAGNPNLVEVHVSSLRRKLEEHGPRLIHSVYGRGYLLRW